MTAMGRRALFVVFCVFALTACARHRVVTQPDLPLLAPPPPRVVAPPETEEQPPAAAPEPGRKPVRRAAPKNEGTQNPPKVEPPKHDTPPKPDTPAAPAREETQPPGTLQTTQPATQVEMERQARGLLAQAGRDLGRVDYNGLNADSKGQYDTAKRFIAQAQQSLKEQNFVLALRLADKAATIAGVLVGR
jgi:outer membrane biosynthesis protein TonB